MPLVAQSDYSNARLEADRLYQNGDFASAHKKYQRLAKEGDSFSQYRVSYMYLMGQGKKVDLIESVAWSVLAAQGKQEDLVDYMQTIARIVPVNKRKKADKKITQYMLKWGTEVESGSNSSGSVNGCTGTRLCNHASSPRRVRMPVNLWTANDSDDDEQLRTRAIDLNQAILKNREAEILGSAQHETG